MRFNDPNVEPAFSNFLSVFEDDINSLAGKIEIHILGHVPFGHKSFKSSNQLLHRLFVLYFYVFLAFHARPALFFQLLQSGGFLPVLFFPPFLLQVGLLGLALGFLLGLGPSALLGPPGNLLLAGKLRQVGLNPCLLEAARPNLRRDGNAADLKPLAASLSRPFQALLWASNKVGYREIKLYTVYGLSC